MTDEFKLQTVFDLILKYLIESPIFRKVFDFFIII